MRRSRPTKLFDKIVAWSFEHPLPDLIQFLLVAVIMSAVAWLRVTHVTDTLPWLLFIPVLLAATLVTGRGPGLAGAALATVFGTVSQMDTSLPWLLMPGQWGAAGLFFFIAILLVLLSAELRDALGRARNLNVELVESEGALSDREGFLSSVLAASTDCIKVLELDGTLSFMSEGGMVVMEISDFNDVKGCAWPGFLKGDGPDLATAALAEARAGRTSHFEAAADTFAGTPKYWSVSVSPIWGSNGQVARVLSVSRDHTAIKASQDQQRLLNDELSHRLKNVLALAQSIASQTLRDADSLEAASAAFASRLASLGRATDVLTATSWAVADLHDVVKAGLVFAADFKERISVTGPEVELAPQPALALTLAIHELTTNAMKYGALSNDTGRVTLSWDVTTVDGDPYFSLLWQEREGPAVAEPSRRGFGSRLIERSLRSYFRGTAELSFALSGVEFRIEAPLSAAGKVKS